MASRESIMAALLAKLAPSFVTATRRRQPPEKLTPALCPALFLIDLEGNALRPAPNLPPVRSLMALAILYNDVGGADMNVIPVTAINNALDALDAALASDNPSTGRCTLGGLVYSALIDGKTEIDPGDLTGKATAIVPIKIILP